MPEDRIATICDTLRQIAVCGGENVVPARNQYFSGTRSLANIAHILYMLNEIPQLVAEDRREKAMRWLGFVQGVVCVWYGVPVEELKQLNAVGAILREEPL